MSIETNVNSLLVVELMAKFAWDLLRIECRKDGASLFQSTNAQFSVKIPDELFMLVKNLLKNQVWLLIFGYITGCIEKNRNLDDFFMFFRPENFSKILKTTHIGEILCEKSTARIPEA